MMTRYLGSVLAVGMLAGMLLCASPLLAATRADQLVTEAKQYLAKGEGAAAAIQLKNALQNDPGHIEARVMLGTLYFDSGNWTGAEKEFNRAGQLGAPQSQWLNGLAQAFAKQNKFEELIQLEQPDKTLSADEAAAFLAMRGHALIALGRSDEAARAYNAALARDPASPHALLGKARILIAEDRHDEAVQQLNSLLAAHPDHAEARVDRGELLRRVGKLDESLADFSRAIEVAPNNLRAHVGRGLVQIARRQPEAAMEDVQALRRLQPNLPISSYIHALAAFQQQKFDVAAEQLEAVMRATPDHVQSQLLYGVVSYARGNYQLADDYLTRVNASIRGNVQIDKLLGATRLKLRQPQRAVEALLTSAEANPEDGQLLALLGTAYMQLGENSKGAEYMAKAVELNPDQALLRTQLALGKLASGETGAAISELESAVDLGQDLIQADVLLVLSYLNKGEKEKALQAAAALEKRLPDSPIPYNLSGLAFMATQSLDQAEERFKKALSVDPGFVVAVMNQARLALLRKDRAAARGFYQQALKLDPKHVGAMLGLAALAQNENNPADLENWLLQANRANPKALQPILLLAEHYLRQREALKANNLLNDLTPEQEQVPGALRIKGMAQLQSGDFSSAVRTLEKLVDLRPDYLEGWFQLARAQAANGDNAGSRRSFDKAIELDSGHEVALIWIGRGELELRERNYDKALEIAKIMQEHFPDNAASFELEAAAYRGRGDIPNALAAVEKAVEVEGSSKRVNLLAHTLAATGDPQSAVSVLRDWLKDNAADGASWTTLGMLQQQLGANDKALAAYQNALQHSPGNPVLINNIAWLYHTRGDRRALELSKQAYEIAPERPEIVDTYGWILYQSGRQNEGLQILQQALVSAPRNPEIGLHVAEALHALGRDAEARPLVLRVMKEHPGSDWYQAAQALLSKLD